MSQIPEKVTWRWVREHILDAPQEKVEEVLSEATRASLPACSDHCPVQAMCKGCGRRMEVIGWVEEVERCYFVCKICDKMAWGESAEGLEPA